MGEIAQSVAVQRRVAFVAARWHLEIVDRAVEAFRREIETQGAFVVNVVYVPGAFEIPLRVQRLARSGNYAAIAACAFVIDGGSTAMNSSPAPWSKR